MTERRPPDDRDPGQRFDEALRRATRSLVVEELPRGILDPGVGSAAGVPGSLDGRVRARRSLPGLAGASAAVAVLLLATAVALGPDGPFGPGSSTSTTAPSLITTSPPSPSPVPSAVTLRPTAEIVADMERLEYACEEGNPVESLGPGPDPVAREAAVCIAPEDLGPFMAAVIVGETAEGWVVQVDAKANLVGEDTPAAREAVAAALAKAGAIAVGVPGAGNEVGDWVVATLPTLERSTGDTFEVDGVSIKIVRSATGGYHLIVHAG